MLKDQGIHQGHWQMLVTFGFAVANMGPNETDVAPSAIAQLVGLGIQRMPDRTPMTVDAAEVNPGSE
jgi:hypothetical protein